MNQSQTSSLSRRLGDAFNDVAAGVVNVPNPAQLRALVHPVQNRPVSVHLTSSRPASAEVCVSMPSQDSLSRRLGPVFAEVAQAANAQQGPKSGQQGVENPNPMPAPAKAYKPTHGGYPG